MFTFLQFSINNFFFQQMIGKKGKNKMEIQNGTGSVTSLVS